MSSYKKIFCSFVLQHRLYRLTIMLPSKNTVILATCVDFFSSSLLKNKTHTYENFWVLTTQKNKWRMPSFFQKALIHDKHDPNERIDIFVIYKLAFRQFPTHSKPTNHIQIKLCRKFKLQVSIWHNKDKKIVFPTS